MDQINPHEDKPKSKEKKMAGWQQVIIVGNVGRSEDLKYLQTGVPVLNFSVAVNSVTGTGDQKQERTTWFRVAAWRQLAESLAPYISKGKQVMVVGTVDARPYADNAGQPAASLEITAREIRLLGSRGDGEGRSSGGNGDYDYAPPPPDSMGDIPF
ncbi:MAG: single-stranded DNA-binding protein [Anaerolineae bacterium]|nr:single-stranded DNA-binding protein [Anaerolineae bacterium]